MVYFNSSLQFKEQTERVLGRYYTEKNGKLKETTDCSYEIPLLKSLQHLLNIEVIREQVNMKYFDIQLCHINKL